MRREKKKIIFEEIMHKMFSIFDESYKPTDLKISTNLSTRDTICNKTQHIEIA